jgi:4-hydroxyphenylpyruvate dioxygenase-like putative hemolysin
MNDSPSRLHHVVFAVARERHDDVGELFTKLGFSFDEITLDELGLRVLLDWNRGIELISPNPGSTAEVAISVTEFLATHGDGVFTVVVQVPKASEAEDIAKRYGSTTRFRQGLEDLEASGNYLEEIDLSVFGLPLTFLSTNLP